MRWVSQGAMNRVVSDTLDNDLFGFQTYFDHLLLNDLCRQLGFNKRIGPGIAEHGLSHHAIFKTSNNLEHFGRRSPFRPDYTYFVKSNLFHTQGGHVHIDIGRHIMAWVMHFVEQLLTQGIKVDAPASARSFADNSITVLPHLGNGIAYVRKIGNRTPISAEVASRRLTAALQEMPDDDTLRQFIPVVPTPVQLVHHWSEKKSSIRDTARQHDIRSCIQRFHQWTRS